MPTGAALRSQIELDLSRRRVSAPFAFRERRAAETASAGIPEIDRLTGGLPRGALTEVCGPDGAGRMSFLVSTLAARTAHSESCVLIDARDAFDPYSAAAAGVELERLLWVRCRNIEQALRATDLVLHSGGFSLIAVDLGDIAPQIVRYVPLHAWFRFRRAVENTPAILLLLDQEPSAKTCASLVLELGAERASWSTTLESPSADPLEHPAACLLDACRSRAGVIRSRIVPADGSELGRDDGREPRRAAAANGSGNIFMTNPAWALPNPL